MERLAGIPHIRKVEPGVQLGIWAERYVQTAAKKLKGAHGDLLGGAVGANTPSLMVTIDETPELMKQHFTTGAEPSRKWLRGATHALAVMTE